MQTTRAQRDTASDREAAERAIERALERCEDRDVAYHLREALQLLQFRRE